MYVIKIFAYRTENRAVVWFWDPRGVGGREAGWGSRLRQRLGHGHPRRVPPRQATGAVLAHDAALRRTHGALLGVNPWRLQSWLEHKLIDERCSVCTSRSPLAGRAPGDAPSGAWGRGSGRTNRRAAERSWQTRGGFRRDADQIGSESLCDRGDSNPHTVKYRNLNPACLPIPPRSRRRKLTRVRSRGAWRRRGGGRRGGGGRRAGGRWGGRRARWRRGGRGRVGR